MSIAPWMTKAITFNLPDINVNEQNVIEVLFRQSGNKLIVIPNERITRSDEHTIIASLTDEESASLIPKQNLYWQILTLDKKGERHYCTIQISDVDEIMKPGGVDSGTNS